MSTVPGAAFLLTVLHVKKQNPRWRDLYHLLQKCVDGCTVAAVPKRVYRVDWFWRSWHENKLFLGQEFNRAIWDRLRKVSHSPLSTTESIMGSCSFLMKRFTEITCVKRPSSMELRPGSFLPQSAGKGRKEHERRTPSARETRQAPNSAPALLSTALFLSHWLRHCKATPLRQPSRESRARTRQGGGLRLETGESPESGSVRRKGTVPWGGKKHPAS